MPKKKVEVYDKDKLIYPFIENDHVTFSNGMKVSEMLDQSISMPTVTHDETSFKVGVGDSDVSSSIVDSSVSKMVIKGQTYQNILPEPSLRNKMIGKSMQRLNEGYDNIEVVDGVSKSAILSGQTLVNLATKNTRHDGNATVTFTDTGHSIKIVFNGSGSRVVSFKLNQTLKSNTKYLFIAKCTKNFDTSPALSFFNGKSSFGMDLVTTSNKDKIIITTTDASLYTHVTFGLHGGMIEGNEFEVDYPVFIEYQEGMENWDIPYFEGMTSCKMPVLKSTGKNLWDNKIFEDCHIATINNDGSMTLNGTLNKHFWFTYTIDKGTYCSSAIGDSGKNVHLFWKGFDSFFQQDGPIIFSEKVELKGYIARGTYNNVNIKLQLEKGTVATSYEPHKSNTLHAPEDLELRGIGGVKDELNVATGELTQRIGEIVLDGSEERWELAQDRTNTMRFNCYSLNIPYGINGSLLKTDKLPYQSPTIGDQEGAVMGGGNTPKVVSISIMKAKLPSSDIDGFKQWLSQNPITVQYELTTESVKTVDLSILDQNGDTQENLHSFANGRLQVSSEAENSLLPSVQYEIPTKNSYHMDLMKTNTLYTMKAKSVSGTFTIDGITYNVNANGTFTSPSSMTDKLLIMSNKTNEEVMVLEGNVVDKTIPYFKGIKSAFEGEDKIEVLSTGKNLFNISKWSSHHNDGHGYFSISGDAITVVSKRDDCYSDTGVTTSGVLSEKYRNMTFSCKPNTTYTCSFTMNPNNPSSSYITFFDKYYNTLSFHNFKTSGSNIVSPNGAKYFTLRVGVHSANGKTVVFSDIQVVEGSKKEEYQSHKSNNTKIPLLSPLRSLPNGVCDEIVLDRLNHKAKLVQRVGKAMFDGSSDEVMWFNTGWTNGDCVACYWDVSRMSLPNKKFGTTNMVCDKFPTVRASIVANGGIVTGEGIWGEDGSSVMYISLNKTKLTELSVNGFRQWASQNPFTVLYVLKTPIITEIDLEGFPYIYKDGHIFLNSEIAPTTQITYSINQAQQIESANENLQRHEKKISRLQKLIAQYIQVEYESTLLSLKI